MSSMRRRVGTGGEIQLTDSMARLIGRQPFHGLRYKGTRYDCGDKVGFIEANIAFALHHPEMGGEGAQGATRRCSAEIMRMQIIILAPVMSALSRRPALPNSAHKVTCVDQEMRASNACARPKFRSTSPGSTIWSPKTCSSGRLTFEDVDWRPR